MWKFNLFSRTLPKQQGYYYYYFFFFAPRQNKSSRDLKTCQGICQTYFSLQQLWHTLLYIENNDCFLTSCCAWLVSKCVNRWPVYYIYHVLVAVKGSAAFMFVLFILNWSPKRSLSITQQLRGSCLIASVYQEDWIID